jgi:hypothetical protein
MTISDAIAAKVEAAMATDTERAAELAADPDLQLVEDPFRPGEQCRRWATEVHPVQRRQTAIERAFIARTTTTETNSEDA